MSPGEFNSIAEHAQIREDSHHERCNHEKQKQQNRRGFSVRIMNNLADTRREQWNKLHINTVNETDYVNREREGPGNESEQVSVTGGEGVGS